MEGHTLITSTSILPTRNAGDYLHQLCKHFAKRVPVTEGIGSAKVTLPIGTCDLTANDTQISALVQTQPENVERMEEVFGGWIERFAFREKPNLTWHRATHPTKD